MNPVIFLDICKSHFKRAFESKDYVTAKKILEAKFEKYCGQDQDAEEFVEILSKQPKEIRKDFYRSSPVNFFYQQDSIKKYTVLHYLAESKEDVEILIELLRGRCEKDQSKLLNILIDQKSGKIKSDLAKDREQCRGLTNQQSTTRTPLEIAIDTINIEFISE